MVISFHGTKKGNNGADAAMVFIAVMTMFRRQRKVLVMSMCNADAAEDIETLADAQMHAERNMSEAMTGGFEFEDNGVDALLRQAASSRLTMEHFDSYVTQFARRKNYLDFAPVTTQKDFENTLRERPDDIVAIFNNAGEVYHDVFVLADAANPELIDMIDEAADKVVIAVGQGKKEELPGTFSRKIAKKTTYLVMDYEPESAYGKRYMQRFYGSSQICMFPHNVLYRDAANMGALVNFAMQNYGIGEQDVNYPLVKAFDKLMDHLSGILEDDGEAEEKIPKRKDADAEDGDAENDAEAGDGLKPKKKKKRFRILGPLAKKKQKAEAEAAAAESAGAEAAENAGVEDAENAENAENAGIADAEDFGEIEVEDLDLELEDIENAESGEITEAEAAASEEMDLVSDTVPEAVENADVVTEVVEPEQKKHHFPPFFHKKNGGSEDAL